MIIRMPCALDHKGRPRRAGLDPQMYDAPSAATSW